MIVDYLSVNNHPEGDIPRDVAFSPDGTTVIVVNRDTDNITLFDVLTRRLTKTISVGRHPVSLAVTANGRYALTANVLSNTVSIIDLYWQRLVANVPVAGEQPYLVKTTSDNKLAVVGVINDGIDSSFSVIDLRSLEEILSFPSGGQGVLGSHFVSWTGATWNIYTQFAISPNDSTIVLPDRAAARVLLYNLRTGEELAALPTSDLPTSVDISADGSTAVIGHDWEVQRITVLDLPMRTVRAVHSTPIRLYGKLIRLTPDDQFAIVSAWNGVLMIDVESGAISADFESLLAYDIEFSFDNRYAFISYDYSRVIDLESQTIVSTMRLVGSYEAATSPTEPLAVSVDRLRKETLNFFNIKGEAGFWIEDVPSGAPPEGDAPHRVAFTSDCLTAVSVNNTSDNLAIIDTNTQAIVAYPDTGRAPQAVSVTPDDRYALVPNWLASHVSVVDLVEGETVSDINVGYHPVDVKISKDGRKAYVPRWGGGRPGYLAFVDLDGPVGTVTHTMSVGYLSRSPGIALSPDERTLALVETQDDTLRLIDTSTQATRAVVPVGDWPQDVVFSHDSSMAYVTNWGSKTVSFVNVAGGFEEDSVMVFVPAASIEIDDTGRFLYVGSDVAHLPQTKVIDTTTASIVASVPLSDRIRAIHYSPRDSILYATTDAPEFLRILAAGPDTTYIDSVALSSIPYDLAFCEATGTAWLPLAIPDGIDIVSTMLFADGFESGDLSGWSDHEPPP